MRINSFQLDMLDREQLNSIQLLINLLRLKK